MSDERPTLPHDPYAALLSGAHIHCRGFYRDAPLYKALWDLDYDKHPSKHTAQTIFGIAHDLAVAPDAIDTTGALALVWTNNGREARIEFVERRAVARFNGGQRLICNDRDAVFALYAIAAYLGGPEVTT